MTISAALAGGPRHGAGNALRRSFLLSGLDRYATFAINLASTAIFARLLAPDEIGVFVVGAGVVMVAEALREFGASVYIIQEREISRQGVRTTFTVMLCMSLVVAGLLLAAAGPLAGFYADTRLAAVVRIAALGVVLGAFASPPLALLRREMAFGGVALVNLTGVLVNFAAALVLLASGWGYLSLALAATGAAAATALAAALYRPKPWIFVPCLVHWRQILAFGGWASATAILNIIFQMLPQMLLGRLLGFDAAGVYSRAVTLCQLSERMIFGAFQPVVLPAFSDHVRSGGDLCGAYLHGLALLTAVQWPSLLCLAVLAEPLVLIVLGPQWNAAAPVLRILALASLVMFPAPLTYPMLVSLGRVRDTLTSSLLTLPISSLVVVAASSMGIEAVAASMFVTGPLQIGVAMVLIRRAAPFDWWDIVAAVQKSSVVALSTVTLPAVFRILIGPIMSYESLALACAGGAAGWLFGLGVSGHPLLIEARGIPALTSSAFRSLCIRRRQA